MKCINCGREIISNSVFNNSNLNELFNSGRHVFGSIEMLFSSGYVYFVCPQCQQENVINANDFVNTIIGNTQPQPAPSTGGGTSSGRGVAHTPSEHAQSSATSKPAQTQTQTQESAQTQNNQLEYYDFEDDGTDYSGGSNYKRDIDLPSPAVIDYAINKIGELKNTIGSFLSGAIAGFSTMGLPGLPSVSSTISRLNKVGGGESNLEKIHTNLKKIDSKLREMDPNYDLYIAIGYLDNLSYDSIIGSMMTDGERDAIFAKIGDTLNNNKGRYNISSGTESDILAASIRAELAMGDTKSATAHATKLQTDIIEGVVSTILKDYAGVTMFERSQGGGILIEKANSYTIGIPANFQGQAMDTIIFYDDAGSYGGQGKDRYERTTHGSLDRSNYRTSTNQVDTLMLKNPNTIVAATKIGSPGKPNGTKDIVSIMQRLGITSNHTIVSGFSAGGNAAVQGAEYILKNYSGLKNVELLLLDTNNLYQIGNGTFQYLAQNGVKATALNSLTESRRFRQRYSPVYGNGIDLSVIHTARATKQKFITTHTDHQIMAFNDNIFGYLLGNTNQPMYTNARPEYQNAAYSYFHINPQTGGFENYIQRATEYVATPIYTQSGGYDYGSNGTNTDWNYGTKVTEAQLHQAFPDASSIRHNNNGVYEVRFAGDTLFVPDNASLENLNIVALWPGNNGHEHDSWVGNAVNGSSNTCVFNGHNITSASRLTNIINNNNVHVSNAQLSVFSASGNSNGGFKGLDQLANIINSTKGNVDNYQVVSYDGSYFGQNISSNTVNTLLQSGTKVYVVASSGGGHPISMYKNAQIVSATGVPTYFIQTGSSNHMQVTPKAFANNIPGAIMGQGSIYNLNGYTSSKV